MAVVAPKVLGQQAAPGDFSWCSFVDKSKYLGWGEDGNQLHGMGVPGSGIPIKRWCVTRQDLLMLRAEVKKAIQGGIIRPTGRDSFDAADNVIGPNMYTVCEQYIKPLTKEAGSMSWALLRNPRGLECDLFITHAWIEGVFEFIDKVVGSWPSGSSSCYVCMLSNPQNLDIAALIKTPRTSPFALCLESASHMLVTPNHHSSIYSRLWCVYEAYLAISLGKTILTAKPRRSSQRCIAVLLLCVPLVCGIVWRGIVNEHCPDMKGNLQMSMFLMIFLNLIGMFRFLRAVCSQTSGWMSRCLSWHPVWLAVDWLGAFGSGSVIYIDVTSVGGICGSGWLDWTYRWFVVVLTLYWFASEIDRMRAIDDEREAQQLLNSFESVAAAQCSNHHDEHTIKSEISGELGDVDMAVSVLLSAGMSTPCLNSAAGLGASVTAAGRIDATSIILFLGFGVLVQILFASIAADVIVIETIVWVLVSSVVITVYGRLFYVRRSIDERAFILSVAGKTLLWGLWLLFLNISPESTPAGMTFSLVVFVIVFVGPALLLAALGLVRIAKIPLFGPLLAGFVGPGTSCRAFRRLSDSGACGRAAWERSRSVVE